MYGEQRPPAAEVVDVDIQAVLDRIPPPWPKVIRCDRGWWLIITRLDREIAVLGPDYHLHQVKQKFGGLRYYWELGMAGVTPEMHEQIGARVRTAQADAARTCERCAAPGTLQGRPPGADPAVIAFWHQYADPTAPAEPLPTSHESWPAGALKTLCDACAEAWLQENRWVAP